LKGARKPKENRQISGFANFTRRSRLPLSSIGVIREISGFSLILQQEVEIVVSFNRLARLSVCPIIHTGWVKFGVTLKNNPNYFQKIGTREKIMASQNGSPSFQASQFSCLS
jgi:hypothetical protein